MKQKTNEMEDTNDGIVYVWSVMLNNVTSEKNNKYK